MMQNEQYGTIKSLWRYPVKSLLGEEIHKAKVDLREIENDRIYAITDAHGKFGSGKNTRRFTQMDGLFTLRSAVENGRISITFPDNITLDEQSKQLNQKLSALLQRDVRLAKEADTPHFDAGAVHILTQHSLTSLQAKHPELQIDVRRFRANIVLNFEQQISDDDLLGRIIRIGSVVLKVKQNTERCRMITLAQADLPTHQNYLKRYPGSLHLISACMRV